MFSAQNLSALKYNVSNRFILIYIGLYLHKFVHFVLVGSSERGDFTVSRPPDRDKHNQVSDNAHRVNSGMDAYMKLKKAGLLKSGSSSGKQHRTVRGN